jgi:F-type H+-transporting ATPase subunit b
VKRIDSSLGAVVLLAGPSLAFAADPSGSAEPEVVATTEPPAAGHGAEAAHASPNLFSVDPGLLIWTIVTFVAVLVVLRFTAWNPLVKSLADRQRSIEGAIEDARRIKTDAETLLAKYEATLKTAKDEARAIVEEARADGRRVQEEIRETAHREAAEFKERARREIELQKDAAIHEIWDLASNLSTDLAGRILGRRLEGSDQDRLVKELVDQMRAEVSGASGGRTTS